MTPPYLPHILSQLTSTLDLLHSENLLTASDLSLIKSRLPSASGQAAPARGTDAALSNEMNSLVLSSVPKPMGVVIAEWDYRSDQAEDITFSRGDRIDLIEESSAEWWLGTAHGKTGIFPSAYVRRESALPPAPPAPATNEFAGPSYHQQQPWQPQPNGTPPYQQQQAYPQYYPQPGVPPPQPYYAPPPPQQQMAPYQDYKPEYGGQQIQQQAPAPVVPEKKPSKLSGYGKIIATSAAGGLGFGAGSALGSDLIHKIF